MSEPAVTLFRVTAYAADEEAPVRDNTYPDRERALEVAWKIATYHGLDTYVDDEEGREIARYVQ